MSAGSEDHYGLAEWIPWAIASVVTTLSGVAGSLFKINFDLMKTQIADTRAELVETRKFQIESDRLIKELLQKNAECVSDREHLRLAISELRDEIKKNG
jgi:hypothetical protein